VSDTGKVKIHGREYETVASRVARFREIAHDWCIATEILHRDDEVVVMKASISDDKGVVKATGHAEEKRASSQINKTSALENAETSAIGRALAALGYAGTEFASADEVANAITQQRAGAHKPSDGAMESLDTDWQTVVRDVASEVHLKMTEGKTDEALVWLEAAMLPADAKVACWSLLPSHFRSALKKHAESKKGVKGLIGMKDDIPQPVAPKHA
jgi:hypothetical protein